MDKRVTVIGGGFSGLSAACYLAKEGYRVDLLEKNEQLGGRARVLAEDGFKFDMGPSWYWMPEVFENFFSDFSTSVSDYYNLVRLDPSYRVFYSNDEIIDIPADWEELKALFNSIESGSGAKLEAFMKEAERKYKLGVGKLVYNSGSSYTDYISAELILGLFQNEVFSSISKHVRKFVKDPRLVRILEFPVLFLGAKPENTPALYSLMNYADLKLGTWYPMGGMGKVVEAMRDLFIQLGGQIHTGEEVVRFDFGTKKINTVQSAKDFYKTRAVVGGADYHFIENKLLPDSFRNYSESYWDSRVLAPSALLFYLGVNKRIDGIQHHNLFFDADFSEHAKLIYDTPSWPENPLFYVSAPSKTDPDVAPEGYENLTILVPLAPGLEDNESLREKCFETILNRFEDITGQSIRNSIVYRKSFGHREFINDYNSFKGNAYGLANTLKQTGPLKPRLRNKKIRNLFYTGQLTVPGPGVPPSLISGKLAADEVNQFLKN